MPNTYFLQAQDGRRRPDNRFHLRKTHSLQKVREKLIEGGLLLCAALSVFITLGTVLTLAIEGMPFFREVPLLQFLTETTWTPLFYEKHYGILPLLSGTLLTTAIAMAVALPMGLITAIYLSEYVPTTMATVAKSALEMLAAVPTVVYGYFALLFVTPFLKRWIPTLASFNALSPGIVMGIMIIPMVASLSEDAMRSVPRGLREGGYALGSTRFQVAVKIVLPAALSGVAASFILSMSRAIGETMIVTIAAGLRPTLTMNPLVPIQTITTYIAQVSMGDIPVGTLEYNTIFAVAIALFIVTFVLNIMSFLLKQRFRETYA